MPAEHRQLRDELHARFRSLSGEAEGDLIAYHLADLHDGFARAARMIQLFADSAELQGEAELRRMLADLAGELFEHIPPHTAKVRPGLERLLADLYEEARRRNEL